MRLVARTSRSSSVAASAPSNSGPSSPPTLPEPLIPLGQSELRVSPLGIGTLQWGDPRSGFGEQYSAADLAEAFRPALAGGINLFDSAEVYGYQSIPAGNSSEQLLGRFVAEEKARRLQEGSGSSQSLTPVAATKFFTIPWTNLLVGGGLRFGRQSLIDALKASLQRLGMERVDLYQVAPAPGSTCTRYHLHQIHFPFPTISNATLMDGLKQAHAEGPLAIPSLSLLILLPPTRPCPSMHRPRLLPHQIHFPFPTISNATLMDGLKQAHAEGPLAIPSLSLLILLPPTRPCPSMHRPRLLPHQIHFPFPTISNATLMDGLKQAHAEGLATAVGVSNYNTQQLQEAHSLLKAANIPLASNQVKFNLLDRGTETNGLLHACKDLQVSLIAYSPLASGLLTDKALTRTDKDAVRVRPLLQLMRAIGEEYGGRSVSQVGKSVSQVGKSVSQVGKSVSQVGKSVSQVGKSVSQVGKSVSQVGKSASQMGIAVDKTLSSITEELH
ncbi:unnamed protein product [Closterium sp. Yama58-4]|nr:unnamed protein product [Closterium sp. Yama58-4]